MLSCTMKPGWLEEAYLPQLSEILSAYRVRTLANAEVPLRVLKLEQSSRRKRALGMPLVQVSELEISAK
jgi:hypothetical protein